MGALYSLLFGKTEIRQRATVSKGIVNAFKNSWRGLVSGLLAIIILGVFFEPVAKSRNTLSAVWLIMAVFMLLEPMPTSACALIPLFALPMLGIMSSTNTCKALINDSIVLFFLGGWLLLLFNNCGLDKRLICTIMAQGNSNSFTPIRLLIKSCVAAFASSAFAERELASQALMGYLVSALGPLQMIKTDGDYNKFKNILCMSVAVSSLLGSMCFIHASLTTLQLRSMFHTTIEITAPMMGSVSIEFPDVFNFIDYSMYAIPVAIIMLIFNTLYEAILVFRCTKKPSLLTQQMLQKSFKKNLQDLGPMTNHEKISIPFYILYMVCFFTRWSHKFQKGWASFRLIKPSNLPGVNDATVAAIFVVILHFLPKSLNFLKICSAKRVGDLPPLKPESGILFWKFVDKHTDYSLFLVFGAGCAIYQACLAETGLYEKIGNFAGGITELNWNIGILIVVMFSVLLGNLMTGMAAQACLMPFFLSLAQKSPNIWSPRIHLVALGVGLGSGLGFCAPYTHTPSFYVRSTGKVDIKTQIIYSIGSSVICGIILWLSLCFFARVVWEDVTRILPPIDIASLIPAIPVEIVPADVKTDAPVTSDTGLKR